MKYQDLIQFDTLERVIELTKSAEKSEAQRLVSSYVISDTMADRLINIVFKQLQYDNPQDNMGLLIVGNYGTGKSHLMSVISSIAADKELVPFLRDKAVADASSCIAGKFKVIRAEVGSVKTSFRDIIVGELEKFLAEENIDFEIPAEDTISNNKGWLEDMMAEINVKYPDKGLLFVLDELLDYLRTRKDMELALDFGFMRELGEVCKNLRFRFIAGIQEAIFDNSRFSFVGDSLRRVHERFEQIDIARNDVKYVVAERLLRKTSEQQQKIREYLDQFAPFYGDMAGRMDEFVRMFPVHPDYIEIFERVVAVEKRMVLRTLSERMSSLLNKEVPADHPGIIAYDSYWETLTGNASFRTIDDVRKVMDCTTTLMTKINLALTKTFRPMATRIINGLAVNRLTTGGIDKPLGVTAAELRDTLCLFDPIVKDSGGEPDEALQGQIEVVLKKIRNAVNGQFISQNPENQQYYIDIHHTEDLDALIEQRAASLDNEKLDYAFYEAMKIMMEVQDVPTKVTGYNIWQFDKVTWLGHKAPRIGYLFFGAPNDRSTAQPPRDYYIYFLRPFAPGRFKNENKSDELFFKLVNTDNTFVSAIRNYAGALELWAVSSGASKARYEQKVREHQKAIVTWLREKNISAFEVTYQGQTKTIQNWLHGTTLRHLAGIPSDDTLNFRDMITTISAYLLDPHFTNQAPDYPVFKTYIPQTNRESAVSDALRVIAGNHSKNGFALLDALQLLDIDKISTSKSIYAQRVLACFKNRGADQVVNRDELLVNEHGVEYFDIDASRLEPDFLIVVLAALVCTGEITLSVIGHKYDATGLEQLASASVEDLINFKHIEQPKDWNLPGLAALFELIGLQSGYASLVTQGKNDAVQKLQSNLSDLVEKIVRIQNNIRNGINFLNVNLLAICGYSAAGNELSKAKEFLEYMQNFDTPSKLKQFKQTAEEVSIHLPAIKMLGTLTKLWDFNREEGQIANYLQSAEFNLPSDNVWISQVRESRKDIVDRLSAAASSDDVIKELPQISQVLKKLKRDYIVLYKKLHQDARMSSADEMKRNKLLNDPRIRTLQELTAIDIMPRQKLADFQNKLNTFRTCAQLTEMQLETSPTCPHCSYSPVREGLHGSASDLLKQMDDQLDAMLTSWTETLLANMNDPITQDNLKLLKTDDAAAIQEFLTRKEITSNPNLIPALKQILNGLKKIVIKLSDIDQALQANGPAKPDELKKLFAEYVDSAVRGESQDKIRIVLE